MARLADFDLAAGQAGLLLGPSGSGKTTLLLAVAGLAHTYSGKVSIDGSDPLALSGADLDRFRGRHIGFVFQDIHLVAGLTVLQNVLIAPFAAGLSQDESRAVSLLQAVGLGDKVRRRAETLSRGEAQRAAIARAMLLDPKLILADEPTASLDDETCDTVTTLLLEAAEKTGAALLIATHDQRLRRRIPRHAMVETMS